MAAIKKEDLSRFKKTMQGIIEFATLLEQATPKRQKRIISELEVVDAPFLEQVLRKVVYFEELDHMDESILAEILSHVTPNLLAYALKGAPDTLKKHLLKHLSYPMMKTVLDEEERVLKTVSITFVEGARRQILKIARELEAKNRFVFELADCPRFQEHTKKLTK